MPDMQLSPALNHLMKQVSSGARWSLTLGGLQILKYQCSNLRSYEVQDHSTFSSGFPVPFSNYRYLILCVLYYQIQCRGALPLLPQKRETTTENTHVHSSWKLWVINVESKLRVTMIYLIGKTGNRDFNGIWISLYVSLQVYTLPLSI